MTDRNRFVYRAEAYYEDPRLDTARNFLTKKARDGWAWRRRRGYPETNTHGGFFSDYKPAIPPAQRVVCRRSKPLEWEPLDWWKDLDAAQLRLYSGYIDSRVRLLGEPYGHAVEAVRASDEIRDQVLALGE